MVQILPAYLAILTEVYYHLPQNLKASAMVVPFYRP